MILNSYMFKRVAVVGVGLMGGSLGLALKKHKLVREVIGVSQKQTTIDQAVKLGVIDYGFTDVIRGVRNADLIVLAAPVDTIIRLLPIINPHIRRGCIVTDLGSAKAEIVDAAQRNLSNPSMFIGSHPMSGSDKRGVDNARDDLYENSYCIMTPTQATSEAVKNRIKNMWIKLGSRIKFLAPEEHDEILSYISHLPHVIAYGLMETVPDKYLEYSSQGLKDTTRIAGSSPELWKDICLANSKNVVKALDEVVKRLSELRLAIVQSDEKSLIQHFTTAKDKRDVIQAKK